ncbi:Uncharacterised protein [uncultured archaeon]|nr:Uncharacterised protein [uncultured archaeon]
MNPAICSAIRSKQTISFDYNGGSRTVEPFCHGATAAGNEVLRGYQIIGYSISGIHSGWKMFRVSGISGLRITDKHFYAVRPGYNPDDPLMTIIYCHV